MEQTEIHAALLRMKGSLHGGDHAALEKEITALEADLVTRRTQCEELRRQLEAERGELERRLAEAHRRSADLASLYVATHRLHMTLDRGEVLEALKEIIASLVGCEEMAVFERIGTPALLVPVASAGLPAGEIGPILPGAGVIGRAALTGETWIASRSGESLYVDGRLTACVPLRLKDEVVGVIALYRMLDHKPSLASADLDMFELLSVHAATALLATRPRTRAGERES